MNDQEKSGTDLTDLIEEINEFMCEKNKTYSCHDIIKTLIVSLINQAFFQKNPDAAILEIIEKIIDIRNYHLLKKDK